MARCSAVRARRRPRRDTYDSCPAVMLPGHATPGMSEGSVPCPGRSDARSVRRAEVRPGQLEKAQDQKSWFLAQFLVVPGIALAHCFGWDRLDKFLDEESGIGGSRAQSRQRFTPEVHRLVARWGVPDVGFQGGLKVGAAFAQPVH